VLEELIEKQKPNRVLIGACLPYLYSGKIRELSLKSGLHPSLMEVIDIRSAAFQAPDKDEKPDARRIRAGVKSALLTGVAKLKGIHPSPVPTIEICQRAMVVGGGIAGLTAALAIADHGFEVDLVERGERLGGNLSWLQKTIDGNPVKTLLNDILIKIEKHPRIKAHTGTRVVASSGEVGNFHTAVESAEGGAGAIEHGVTILATGGSEAVPSSYNYGKSEAIITQKELEVKISEGLVDPAKLESVVMIQCVDSREEPRNYCSRVCCASALKHALEFKEKNPDIAVYIFYRDMMSYGFMETYFTRARKSGIIFIQYDVDKKPVVTAPGSTENDAKAVQVTAFDPILGRNIRIDADLLVLSTGIVPNPQADLASSFGASVGPDGFFQEAEFKWRPVDSIKEGVFACGLALSPRSITEAIATAEAAAQRSIRILSQKNLPSGKIVASVHHSLCSLCERCIDACPYGARSFDEDLEKIVVNPVMCQGCGSCAAICPNSASVLEGFREEQMFEIIDAALEGI
jgi:heterodisulfide reductase subunit A